MASLPRIYFSTNDPIGNNRFGLDFPTALRDIAAMNGQPHIGMRVLLYDVDEVEVEGNLDWDEAGRRWLGVPDWQTQRWSY
jgi:hypothetical protein